MEDGLMLQIQQLKPKKESPLSIHNIQRVKLTTQQTCRLGQYTYLEALLMFSNKIHKLIFSLPLHQLKLVQMANSKVVDLASHAALPAQPATVRHLLIAQQRSTTLSMNRMQMEDTTSATLN